MEYTPHPFDKRDKQWTWNMLWLAIVANVIASSLIIVVWDLFATEGSVLFTLSFNSGWFFVRYPWVLAGLVGVCGHIALQWGASPFAGYSVWLVLSYMALYAATWHTGQYHGLWSVMTFWPMYVMNFVVTPLVFAYIWGLRPTY